MRFDNDADAARAYLSERLKDQELRDALVRSAVEYERATVMEEAPS
jgi:hypothetical protein